MKLTKKAAEILFQDGEILLTQTDRMRNGEIDIKILDAIRNTAWRLRRYAAHREIKYSDLDK